MIGQKGALVDVPASTRAEDENRGSRYNSIPLINSNTNSNHKQDKSIPTCVPQGTPNLSLFKYCREAVTAEAAARRYGMQIDRQGKAVCPFHNDHSPSMTFRAGKYRCWACGAAGDSIDFTERLLGLEPIAAVRRLNEDFHLALPIDRPPSQGEIAEAEKQRRLANTRRRFETWREEMLRNLNPAFRIGHLALQSGEVLTDREALAVRWMTPIEAWADALEGENMDDIMVVFRCRKGVSCLCREILTDSLTRSTMA